MHSFALILLIRSGYLPVTTPAGVISLISVSFFFFPGLRLSNALNYALVGFFMDRLSIRTLPVSSLFQYHNLILLFLPVIRCSFYSTSEPPTVPVSRSVQAVAIPTV